MSANPEISRFAGPEVLAATVAGRWLDLIAAAGAQGRRHLAALSGGRITHRLFAEVVAQSRTRGLSLAGVDFFWADERCLPPSDAESNFRMAQELLFGPLKIAAGQIHRLKGELEPEAAAQEASAEILRVAPVDAGGRPVLDLILLGMGEDGHVASLFPGASAAVWRCGTPYLVIRESPKPPPIRLSLSLGAIVAARETWVLASGAGKEQALSDSLAGADRTPLGRVIGARTLAGTGTRVFADVK